MGYDDDRVLFMCEALLVAETPLRSLCWGRVNSFLRDKPGGLAGVCRQETMDLDIFSKLGSSHVGLISVVAVKRGSEILWYSSYQGVQSMSPPVDSGPVVTALTNRVWRKG